ncbi:MAG: 3-dehydroquinate synthase [Clostridium perfringens]|nr:3-dehydroquinate synthase [Clostridium perfringens]
MRKLKVNLKERSYDILIEKDLKKDFGKLIKDVFNGKKICVITDNNLNSLYGDSIKEVLEEEGFLVNIVSITPGEKSKNFNTVIPIYDKLLDFNLTRSDLIVAFGGGVVGDLAGFIASTFLRGVKFVQIPTSLLAQVDSSVGGKVGIDLPKGKNLVGAFYQPSLVLIDTKMLETLPEKFLNDGMGEVIKYGCIRDRKLFERLNSFKGKTELLENIDEIIYTCCDIKRQVVENDEKDTGERMILNFGHTLGHSIEVNYGFESYTHGEGVAIGMYKITKISESLALTKPGEAEKIKSLLVKYDLPFETCKRIDNEEIKKSIFSDKKNLKGSLNVILIKDIGESFIYKTDVSFFDNLQC